MKVLVINPIAHYPGHPAAYLPQLIRGLQGNGCEVSLVTFCGLRENAQLAADRQYTAVRELAWAGTLLRRSGYRQLGGWKEKFHDLWMSFCCLILARRIMGQVPFDAIHLQDGEPFINILLSMNNQVRTIVPMFHGYAYLIQRKAIRQEGLARVLVELVRFTVALPLRLFLKNGHSFVVHSKFDRALHQGTRMAEKVSYIPVPVVDVPPRQSGAHSRKTARGQLSLPDGATVFLVFGINHVGKNYRCIFEALKHWSDRGDVLVMFAGEIAYKGNPMNDADLLESEYRTNRVRIVDTFIPSGELPTYFDAADAIILSYQRRVMASSGVLSDACGYAVPVLASNRGLVGSWVENYRLGLVFGAEDADALRREMERFLYMSEAEKERIRANLKQFAKENSWSRAGSAYCRVYGGETVDALKY
jgi:glycosyltransferase involved in cell wall biosynthesis